MPEEDTYEVKDELTKLHQEVDALARHVRALPAWKEATRQLLADFAASGGDPQAMWNYLWKEMSPTPAPLPETKTV